MNYYAPTHPPLSAWVGVELNFIAAVLDIHRTHNRQDEETWDR